jgi:hypothetical protein
VGVVWGKVEESGFGRAVSCCGTGVRLSRQALDALTVTPEPNENGGSLNLSEVREAASFESFLFVLWDRWAACSWMRAAAGERGLAGWTDGGERKALG